MVRDDAQKLSDLNLVTQLEEGKMQDSALHRGNFLEPNKMRMQIVSSLAGIDSIKLPSTWLKIEQSTALADARTFRPSNIDNAQISFFGSKRPVDEESGKTFKQLINSDSMTPRIIYAEGIQADNEANIQTIKDLSKALGGTTVGDNQLTSSSARRPAFQLETAKVETINGKNVISVDGWFTQLDERAEIKMDEAAPAKRLYSGIFFEAKAANGDVPKIKELYLLADDTISFASNKASFKNALKSIEWK